MRVGISAGITVETPTHICFVITVERPVGITVETPVGTSAGITVEPLLGAQERLGRLELGARGIGKEV